MGCCYSNEAVEDIKVNTDLANDKKQSDAIYKLLFLGSGGTGKTTLFKQLKKIHGDGFWEKDRAAFREHIYSQIIDNMKQLVESIEDLKNEFPGKYGGLKLSDASTSSGKFFDYVLQDMDVNTEVANHVEILWKDPSIKEVYKERTALNVDESAQYFFENVQRIAMQSYVPSDKDILMVRHRTTGVHEEKFTILKTNFHVCDVGGQKTERKKWIHCFEKVTAMIFVASLSSYDEVIFEDATTNSMIDCLELFDETINLRWFAETSVILFLNKKDLFRQKIKKVPLKTCFPKYKGPNTYEASSQYVKLQFEEKNKNARENPIYVHMTCATDKENVKTVFNDVQHVIISGSLTNSGLL